MKNSSRQSARRQFARESFRNAETTIGKLSKGCALFVVTRGQFSMLDAVQWCLTQTAPARLSIWTWISAKYEIGAIDALRKSNAITHGLLVIDGSARQKNKDEIADWKAAFGAESVRYVRNHAKIATIEGNGLRLLLRGSMNLNHNPRFEQLDITEGCGGFDLVREIEAELPILGDDATNAQIYKATKAHEAFDALTIDAFAGAKTWAK